MNVHLGSQLLVLPLLVVGLSLTPLRLGGQSTPVVTSSDRPNPTSLRPGDLIWPKKKGQVVPLAAGTTLKDVDDEEQWNRERNAYLQRIGTTLKPSVIESQRFQVLSPLTYALFLRRYLSDEEAARPLPPHQLVYVGHVALVHFVRGAPWIVEATRGLGVRSLSYERWLSERSEDVIWHGRVADIDETKGSAIANAALQFVGKPYGFFNWDLDEESSFYCAKLAWLAVRKATGMAADGESSPTRRFWLTPKRLMNSSRIRILFNPAEY